MRENVGKGRRGKEREKEKKGKGEVEGRRGGGIMTKGERRRGE